MGNWFGKDKGVQPVDDEGLGKTTRSSSGVKIKVRMTTRQFKELVAQVDKSKPSHNSELGRLILQQCLEGKFSSPVVNVDAGRNFRLSETKRSGCRLSTIYEGKKYS